MLSHAYVLIVPSSSSTRGSIASVDHLFHATKPTTGPPIFFSLCSYSSSSLINRRRARAQNSRLIELELEPSQIYVNRALSSSPSILVSWARARARLQPYVQCSEYLSNSDCNIGTSRQQCAQAHPNGFGYCGASPIGAGSLACQCFHDCPTNY